MMDTIAVVFFLAVALLVCTPPLILILHNYFFDAVLWTVLAIQFWIVTLAICFERLVDLSGIEVNFEAY